MNYQEDVFERYRRPKLTEPGPLRSLDELAKEGTAAWAESPARQVERRDLHRAAMQDLVRGKADVPAMKRPHYAQAASS